MFYVRTKNQRFLLDNRTMKFKAILISFKRMHIYCFHRLNIKAKADKPRDSSYQYNIRNFRNSWYGFVNAIHIPDAENKKCIRRPDIDHVILPIPRKHYM